MSKYFLLYILLITVLGFNSRASELRIGEPGEIREAGTIKKVHYMPLPVDDRGYVSIESEAPPEGLIAGLKDFFNIESPPHKSVCRFHSNSVRAEQWREISQMPNVVLLCGAGLKEASDTTEAFIGGQQPWIFVEIPKGQKIEAKNEGQSFGIIETIFLGDGKLQIFTINSSATREEDRYRTLLSLDDNLSIETLLDGLKRNSFSSEKGFQLLTDENKLVTGADKVGNTIFF